VLDLGNVPDNISNTNHTDTTPGPVKSPDVFGPFPPRNSLKRKRGEDQEEIDEVSLYRRVRIQHIIGGLVLPSLPHLDINSDDMVPIDTNVPRVRPYAQPYSAFIKSHSQGRQRYSPFDHPDWVNSYPTPHLTPPSAPDSGVTTPGPEYMSATSGPQYDWSLFNQYATTNYGK
jgi:hypothetical protein